MRLLSLVKRVQNQNDEKALMEILQMFEPKLRRSLRGVHWDKQEDYRQEIYIRLIKAIRKYNIENTLDLSNFCNTFGIRRRRNRS